MLLKRNINQFIQSGTQNIFGALLVWFFFNLPNINAQKFKISNLCAMNYNSLQTTSLPPSGGTGNPPADPTKYYFTSTTFIDTLSNTSDWVWNFGDSSPVENGKIVQHNFLNPGSYTVSLTRKNGGISETITEVVNIQLGPKIPFLLSKFDKRDTSLCDPITLPLKTQSLPSNYIFEWYPSGANTRTIRVDTSDLYSLKVTDPITGCSVVASVAITICGTPNPPRQSIAQYHFGDGIVRVADHGNAQFATLYPVRYGYLEPGVVKGGVAASSVSSPNMYHYQRYLFTSDGNTIYGRNGIVATNISGATNNALQTLIVPRIEGDSSANTQNYIFTVNSSGQLSYTLIDGRGKPEGEAKVVQKNVPLLSNMTGKLVASPYFNGNKFVGYYVVALGKDGNYYTFKVGKLGLYGPIISKTSNTGDISYGQIKFSSDGKKIVSTIASPPQNQLEICNFDSTTGMISGCNRVNLANNGKVYGVEYSPKGDYIFYTLNSGGKSQLMRYDVANNKSMLVQQAEGNEQYGALESIKIPGYQTEIIMAVDGEKYISSLERPDALIENLYLTNDRDTTVAFRQEKLKFTLKTQVFNNAKSTLGLNNSAQLPPNNSPSSDALQFKNECEGEAITFQATPQCDVDKDKISYEWDFGDGSPVGTGQTVSHTYKKAGQYPVKLFITYCGKTPVEVDDLVLVIPKALTDILPEYENCFKTTPEFPISVKITNIKDLEIYYDSQLEYEWKGANIVSAIDKNKVVVNNKTKLELTVKNFFIIGKAGKTCVNKFKTDVKEFCPPVFVVPDVFSPNNDGINDTLELVKNEIDSENYQFRIFNRWGELVYFSEKGLVDTNPWDGKFHGQNCEADTYAWTVEYRSVFKPNGITYKNQGALILVR